MGRKERLELCEPSVRELPIIKIVCGFNTDELPIGREGKFKFQKRLEWQLNREFCIVFKMADVYLHLMKVELFILCEGKLQKPRCARGSYISNNVRLQISYVIYQLYCKGKLQKQHC